MTPKRLPKAVTRALARLSSQQVVVATVMTVACEDCARLAALDLNVDAGAILDREPVPPARERGRYAKRNLDGWTIKRDDLPMEPRDVSHWAPNWHGSGTHLVSRQIMAYPVEYHPSKLLTVSAVVLEQLSGAAVIRVRVDQPLDRSAPDFADDLLFNLSLLREYCGDAHLFNADMTDAEFALIQRVDWELLPPGSIDRIVERLATSSKAYPHRVAVATERLRTLDRLKPDAFISGKGKFSSYFGARFGDTLVALENLEYGNALYLFEADWERLSQMSRTELIKNRDQNVRRVPHIAGWQSMIRKLLRSIQRKSQR